MVEASSKSTAGEVEWKSALYLFAFICLGFMIFFGIRDPDYSKMLICGISAGTILVFAHLGSIARWKVSISEGLELETREVIAEAKHTIDELRALAEAISSISLSLVKRSGRFGGFSDDEAAIIKQSIDSTLAQLGVEPNRIDEISAEWFKWQDYDYASFILGGNQTPHHFPDGYDIMGEWGATRPKWPDNITTPEVLETFLRKHSCLSEFRSELLDDYRHFLLNRNHRRPDVWAKRREWANTALTPNT